MEPMFYGEPKEEEKHNENYVLVYGVPVEETDDIGGAVGA